MGFIPEQIPETGRLSIEVRTTSVVITGPTAVMTTYGDPDYGRLELDWDQLPRMRACLDQAEWVRRGRRGETFTDVAMAFTVLNGGTQLALTSTAEGAEALAEVARKSDFPDAEVRPVPFMISPELFRAIEAEREAAARREQDLREMNWALVRGAFIQGEPISFISVHEGEVSGLHLEHEVVALDQEARTFRTSGSDQWLELDGVCFVMDGDGAVLNEAVGELGQSTLEEIAARLRVL
ncbi:hypothetical protein [Miltoncostaea oceani]|uniref:hypothetical protein n=1 Tax=Miltoncostaea oceani TaxID=2843216 RepID=UPI001C3C4472|nr:hypothetical protein [Miltoncostaea oceani]